MKFSERSSSLIILLRTASEYLQLDPHSFFLLKTGELSYSVSPKYNRGSLRLQYIWVKAIRVRISPLLVILLGRLKSPRPSRQVSSCFLHKPYRYVTVHNAARSVPIIYLRGPTIGCFLLAPRSPHVDKK